MRKIIHLSDIHCSGSRIETFKTITGKVREHFSPDECVVCLTGDLVDDATIEGAFTQPLEEIYKLRDEGYEVLVAPGNHDYGGGSRFGDDVQERVLHFKQMLFSHQNTSKNIASPQFYPNCDIVGHGNEKIGFIGLDSNEGELTSWFRRYGADGRFGEAQLTRLENMLYTDDNLASCAYRVIYFHHHACECILPEVIEEFHELHDRHRLGEIIERYSNVHPEKSIDALLYGHEHYFKMEEPGLWGVSRCYDAGSSTGKITDGMKKWYLEKYKKIPPTSGIRIIDLAGEDETVHWI